jgi:hypothetical protein
VQAKDQDPGYGDKIVVVRGVHMDPTQDTGTAVHGVPLHRFASGFPLVAKQLGKGPSVVGMRLQLAEQHTIRQPFFIHVHRRIHQQEVLGPIDIQVSGVAPGGLRCGDF